MTAFMLAVGCVAVGCAAVYRLAVPPRADLLGSVHRWDTARARADRVQRIGAPPTATIGFVAVNWVAEQIGRRYRHLVSLNQDLAVSGTTLESHLTRVLGLACLALLGPAAILTALDAAGLQLPLLATPLVSVGLCVAMVAVVHRELTETARQRRAQFRRTLSIYLDLVAMSMQAGRGYAEALPAAAAIGTGWAFIEVRDTIEGARFSGITPWAALGRLGERFGIPELIELDGALRLANEDGAKVKATLVARASTLRAQRIADAEADANQATESMKFALIVMVFAFLVYELYPSIARLFAG